MKESRMLIQLEMEKREAGWSYVTEVHKQLYQTGSEVVTEHKKEISIAKKCEEF